MKKTEIAYMAGIIDGEGTISMSIGNQISKFTGNKVIAISRTMRVTNTNVELLEWLKNISSYGKVSKLWQNPSTKYDRFRKDNVKPLYAWTVHGSGMRELLKRLLPYMIVKKPQAILLIESLHLARKRGDGIAYSDSVIARQIEIRDLVRKLNQRGTTIHASI